MTNQILAHVSVLHLLIEMLKDGRAAIIPELAGQEPFQIQDILTALRQKTNVDYGYDKQEWCKWYVELYEGATDHERETLKLLKKMLDDQKMFSERIAKKRGPRHDST